MPIGISDVRAYFSAVVLGLGEKVRAPGSPITVDLRDVPHPHVEKRTGSVRIRRCCEGDSGFIIGRPTADVENQPRIRHFDDYRVALEQDLGVEQGL